MGPETGARDLTLLLLSGGLGLNKQLFGFEGGTMLLRQAWHYYFILTVLLRQECFAFLY